MPWIARFTFGVIGPVACFATAFGLAVFTRFGGAIYLCAATIVAMFLVWLCFPTRRPRLAAFFAGGLAVGVFAAIGFGVLFTASGIGALVEGLCSGDLEIVSYGLLGVMPVASGTVYGLQLRRALLVAARPDPAAILAFVLLGAAAPAAGAGLGHYAITKVDHHCARVLIEEGEAGLARLSTWEPIVSLLALDEVEDEYEREVSRSKGRSCRAQDLDRAYARFTKTRYLGN